MEDIAALSSPAWQQLQGSAYAWPPYHQCLYHCHCLWPTCHLSCTKHWHRGIGITWHMPSHSQQTRQSLQSLELIVWLIVVSIHGRTPTTRGQINPRDMTKNAQNHSWWDESRRAHFMTDFLSASGEEVTGGATPPNSPSWASRAFSDQELLGSGPAPLSSSAIEWMMQWAASYSRSCNKVLQARIRMSEWDPRPVVVPVIMCDELCCVQ